MKQVSNPQAIGAFEAKTHLSSLLEKVRNGQSFIISKNGKAIAELTPISAKARLSHGCDKGKISISKDFNEPLSDFDDYQ